MALAHIVGDKMEAEELDAEATAHFVGARAGIKSRAAEYLTMHVTEHDLGGTSVRAIVAAVDRIEARRGV